MNTRPDPQMAAILDRIAAAPPAPDYKTMPIEEARPLSDAASLAWNAGAPDVPSRELTIPGDGHAMRARLYEPRSGARDAVLVYAHGGGWTFGSVETHDHTMRRLALALDTPVLGFDYRLSPEHPFPAPLDDTLSAIAFTENGGLGAPVPAARIAVGGDSAGANLALAALIARRDSDLPALAAGALFYGCYAPDFSTASHASFGDGRYLLSSVNMRWYWSNFLGSEPDDTTCLAVPLRADLSGLPPLYFSAAGLDPLRDDTLMLAERLAAAGALFRFDHVPGVVHGCLRMARELDAAQRMIRAAGDFLSLHINDKPQGGDLP